MEGPIVNAQTISDKAKAALLATALVYAGTVDAAVAAQQGGAQPAGQVQKASDDQYDEPQMGKELFDQLRSEGEIVASSPLYGILEPLAQRITRVVQPQYDYPIHFYVVHEAQPNAFAAPGGNVYVTDSLFYFVRNTEELTGTICHETSHLLHHDSARKMADEKKIAERAVGATISAPSA